MPATLYLRNTQIGVGTFGNTNNRACAINRGTTATSIVTNTVASGTWVSIRYFASPPIGGTFSLTGTTSFNLRGLESATAANASLGVRVYRWSRLAGLSASLGQLSSTTELGTAQAARTASTTSITATFNSGDHLVFEVGIINIGTMGGGRTVTLFYDGPTSGASGDSFITIAPNITFQRRATLTE